MPSDGTCTLILVGNADLAVSDEIVEAGIASLGEPLIDTIRIDLAGVTFIDSSTVGALVKLRNITLEQDQKLMLVAPSHRVLRILKLAGLQGVFDIV